jgi:hypothetical protein
LAINSQFIGGQMKMCGGNIPGEQGGPLYLSLRCARRLAFRLQLDGVSRWHSADLGYGAFSSFPGDNRTFAAVLAILDTIWT